VVQDVVVLIDRMGGAREALAEAGYRLHAVLTMDTLLEHWEMVHWEMVGLVAGEQIDHARAFLHGKHR